MDTRGNMHMILDPVVMINRTTGVENHIGADGAAGIDNHAGKDHGACAYADIGRHRGAWVTNGGKPIALLLPCSVEPIAYAVVANCNDQGVVVNHRQVAHGA